LLVLCCFSWSLDGQESAGDAEDEFGHLDAPGGLANPVARLQHRLADGTAKLTFKPSGGYLSSLLEALQVPVSSQALVFSKTSSQRDQTSPKTPRAIYFSDDVSVGFVPGAPVLDVAAVDPNRGPIFYTLDQRSSSPPRFTRRSDCRQCHVGPKTMNVPGLLVRSVYTASDGTPLSQVDGFVNGHRSPLEQRWGGWYVSGTHAGALHLGNLCSTNRDNPERLDLKAGANVTDLRKRFESTLYPSPHSDVVALLVLEHQVRMQNLLTRANLETRAALEEEAENSEKPALKRTGLPSASGATFVALRPASGQPQGRSEEGAPSRSLSDWAQQRIALAGETLLEYMLFRDEAPLKGRVTGTSSFAREFERRGPRDAKGRSLRDFDLQMRLFRYPCSFMIYSAAFDSLPQPMKNYLWGRLEQIVAGNDKSATYATLKAEDRVALLEILIETKPEFAAWLRK
jgi:hypothetical protein